MSNLQEIAQQIIDDHKYGDIDVVDLISNKVLISDFSDLREILMSHVTSFETNTAEINSADLAVRFINMQIGPNDAFSCPQF